MRPTVAILGVGSMGRAIAQGLERAGWPASDVTLLVRQPEKVADLAGSVVSPPRPVDADVLVVAVKPHQATGALEPFGDRTGVVLSVMAGVPLARVAELVPQARLARAMPNTPALISEGVSGVTFGNELDESERTAIRAVLAAIGDVVELSEDALDVVTAVSGSGPAYVFLLAEWLEAAALAEGLEPEAARRLVTKTLRGAALLLDASNDDPAELRRQVTSPGGTTEAAVEVLQEADSSSTWQAAIAAATDRSRELGARLKDTPHE